MQKNIPPYVPEGNRFKTARKLLKLRQQDLAERSGISLATIKSYERGVSLPKKAYAQKLGEAGINMLYIATGTGPPIITPDMYPKVPSATQKYRLVKKQNYKGNFWEEVPDAYTPQPGEIVGSAEELGRLQSNAQVVIRQLYEKLNFDPQFGFDEVFANLIYGKDITEYGAGVILNQIKELMDFYEEKVENSRNAGSNDVRMETLKAQAEIARKEAEAAKAQARAEIAEARLEILKPQVDNYELVRDMLKRTQAQLAKTEEALKQELAQTEKALKQVQADVTSIKKNRQQAA